MWKMKLTRATETFLKFKTLYNMCSFIKKEKEKLIKKQTTVQLKF